jgi:tetratricopeptide (TPR) repeat protein
MKKIFISYASKDKWVREWLVPKLEAYGIDVQADYKTFLFGKSSLENIELAIENSHHIFLVITENWLASEWTQLESLILQSESPTNRDLKYFILKREECRIPKRLKPFTYVDLTEDSMLEAQIGRLLQQIGINTSSLSYTKLRQKPQLLTTSRLPETSGLLFGREKELKLLDETWEDPHAKIITFVAQGGEGKTALVRRWLNNLEIKDFDGAKNVYAWSFYSQGASQDRQISSRFFLDDALREFGDPNMAEGKDSDETKARRLATLIRQYKTLLILDGLEPLQYPPGGPHNGRIHDGGMRTLLKELAGSNNGLCIVSTRVWIAELDTFKGQGVIQERLPHLTTEAGAVLLDALGVKGLKAELEKAAEEFHGHALAMTLLGTLLARYHKGDVQKRRDIPRLAKASNWGGHAERVLAYYAAMFEGKPELEVLRILGLFDRPAEPSAILALRKSPVIPAIIDRLQAIGGLEWTDVLQNLYDLSLLEEGDDLDCHPLIREYFAQQLTEHHESAWKAAHHRLYEHYKGIARELPDTLAEMEPLYRAMGHGCKAGLYKEAFDLYWERIRREETCYSINVLCAFGSDLAAIANFFQTHWLLLKGELQEWQNAFLYHEAGNFLLALGRTRDAIEPMEAALNIYLSREQFRHAALSSSNLGELYLTLGEIPKAVINGRNALKSAVVYSEKSGDLSQEMARSTVLAHILNQAGEVEEALNLFRQAEKIQSQTSGTKKLYSLAGYYFCDLLLENGNWNEVIERSKQALEISKENDWLLDISLDQLSLGKAVHLRAIAEGSSDFSASLSYLDQAVEGLKKAGTMDHVPRGLLSRAALYRDMQAYVQAQADLDEVKEIANPEMRLHLCDYDLESVRLCIAMGGRQQEAQYHYENAKKLVAEIGYRRRDQEVADLGRKLGDSKIKRKQHFSRHFISPIGYDIQEGNAAPVESEAPALIPNPEFDLNNIIKLLENAFDVVGFETFVMGNFFEIYSQFTPGMMQQARINLFITRVNILGKMEAMLEGVKTKNEHQFKACGPYVKS